MSPMYIAINIACNVSYPALSPCAVAYLYSAVAYLYSAVAWLYSAVAWLYSAVACLYRAAGYFFMTNGALDLLVNSGRKYVPHTFWKSIPYQYVIYRCIDTSRNGWLKGCTKHFFTRRTKVFFSGQGAAVNILYVRVPRVKEPKQKQSCPSYNTPPPVEHDSQDQVLYLYQLAVRP